MLMLRKLFLKLGSRVNYFYKLFIVRDPFLCSVRRWFADHGDETLRLDYRLDKSSIVFDVGGYLGDYAAAIYQKYGCSIYLFEPVQKYYGECIKRFRDKSSVVCLNYGLSSRSGWFEMNLNKNESSFTKMEAKGLTQQAEVRSIAEVVNELGIVKIDLIKINIEGGEFDLLPAIIDSDLIKRIKYIQVQFHNFDASASDARSRIRSSLEKTHREMWNYEFVWESWELL